jgi:pimeloyl-ACP methyl ester carboxylesterase
MPVVLLHGNPETPVIWEPLVAVSDAEMNRCILALYRSATQPAMVHWGEELGPAATRPGLALIAPNDPFVRAVDLAAEVAALLGAKTTEMTGQGHWWMLGDPAGGAAALEAFWALVDG